jgi:hypothetical protein
MARNSAYAERWQAIDCAGPVPAEFIVPEHHYRLANVAGLSPEARIRLNHLAVCFTCELFIHFERYVIRYLEDYRHRVDGCPDRHLDRFVTEERVHTEAFYRLLEMIRPDLYPTRTLRFMQWSALDDWMLRVAPPVSFFVLASLFEEITLFVPDVMEERPDQSYAPVFEIMQLHAKEERGHIALDTRVLGFARKHQPAWKVGAQMMWSMPLLACADLITRRAWRSAAELFADEEGLSSDQLDALLSRPASKSDVLGISSFAGKMRASGLAGAGLVASIIERQAK